MRIIKKFFSLKIFFGFVAIGAVLFMAGTGQAKDSIWGKINDPAARYQSLANYNHQAVLDRETGLVWEQCPDAFSNSVQDAKRQCYRKFVGGRSGWRVPNVDELRSLGDPGQTPFLPHRAPFCTTPNCLDPNNINCKYWSSTPAFGNLNQVYVVPGSNGGNDDLAAPVLGINLAIWCVRGGSTHDSGQ